MFKSEGLEFCLDGRNESADDLEWILAKCMWRDRNHLPEYLLVVQWNGFGRLGRTTIFQFFVHADTDRSFHINHDPKDLCSLGPVISSWANEMKAATWGRFEDLYADEPAILFGNGGICFFYSEQRFKAGTVPQFEDIDFNYNTIESPFKSNIELRNFLQLSDPGIYCYEISKALFKAIQGF